MKVEKINFKYKTDLISETQFMEHYKLYEGYLNNINNHINDLFIDSYQANGVILHEKYFEQLGRKSQPTSEIMKNLFNSDINIYNAWKKEFIELAQKSKEGWCLLVYDTLTHDYRNILMEMHDRGIIVGCIPIIVLDTFTHAYFLDYMTDRLSYFKNFIKCLDWTVINKRVKKINML